MIIKLSFAKLQQTCSYKKNPPSMYKKTARKLWTHYHSNGNILE